MAKFVSSRTSDPIKDWEDMPGDKFKRRVSPRDWEVERWGGAPDPALNDTAAARDYYDNLRRFSDRKDDMAAEPNRSKKNESDQKPA